MKVQYLVTVTINPIEKRESAAKFNAEDGNELMVNVADKIHDAIDGRTLYNAKVNKVFITHPRKKRKSK
jgi:hypothetical protein